MKRFTLILWVVSGLAFFIVGAGIIGVAIGVIHPIAKMTRVMKRLADGEMNDDVPALTRDDEVGAMAKAVQVFKENALRVGAMKTEQIELASKTETERHAAMLQIADGFEKAIGKVVRTVSSASTEIETAAGHLTKSADTTQHLSASVAAASEQSSSNVQGRARREPGRGPHRRSQSRRRGHRGGGRTSPWVRTFAAQRKQPSNRRSRKIPRDGSRGVTFE